MLENGLVVTSESSRDAVGKQGGKADTGEKEGGR